MFLNWQNIINKQSGLSSALPSRCPKDRCGVSKAFRETEWIWNGMEGMEKTAQHVHRQLEEANRGRCSRASALGGNWAKQLEQRCLVHRDIAGMENCRASALPGKRYSTVKGAGTMSGQH